MQHGGSEEFHNIVFIDNCQDSRVLAFLPEGPREGHGPARTAPIQARTRHKGDGEEAVEYSCASDSDLVSLVFGTGVRLSHLGACVTNA